MQKHYTPGPWSTGTYRDLITNARSLAVLQDKTPVGAIANPICIVTHLAGLNETDEANARLMSAAPELLEALDDLRKWVEGLTDWAGGTTIDPPVEKARTAIARATNEYPRS